MTRQDEPQAQRVRRRIATPIVEDLTPASLAEAYVAGWREVELARIKADSDRDQARISADRARDEASIKAQRDADRQRVRLAFCLVLLLLGVAVVAVFTGYLDAGSLLQYGSTMAGGFLLGRASGS